MKLKLNKLMISPFPRSRAVIEICDSETHEVIAAMSEAMYNGKAICAKLQLPQGATAGNSTSTAPPATEEDDQPSSLEPVSDFVIKPLVTSMVLEQARPRVSTLVQKMKQITRFFHSPHAVSGFVQFWVLFRLMWTKIVRNRTVLWIQFLHHVICAMFVGRFWVLLIYLKESLKSII